LTHHAGGGSVGGMPLIQSCAIPDGGLLHSYLTEHGFADCYTTALEGAVSHEEFVTAFYTTWLFKVERWILRWAVSKPSTDRDAEQLARGLSTSFAAWRVEARGNDQLLMCDFLGNTRSWLMVASQYGRTQLYFGSAIVARRDPKTGQRKLGWTFRALLGFHRLYSRMLLRAARSRLKARTRQ
jgi:hypothetical protein